jgi:hypothetical protein
MVVPFVILGVHLGRRHMGESGTMAILTSNREFGKCWVPEMTISFRQGIGATAVTGDAAGQNRTIETSIAQFIAWRKLPSLRLGVEREWRLKNEIPAFEKRTKSVLTRADDPLHFSDVSKQLMAV